MNPYYKDYSQYLTEKFGEVKVQKLSIDAGFTCPNRDGTFSRGGCIYCNVKSFTPGYCDPKESVAVQLEKGKKFFSRKYPRMKYLAYFQSFTGTHSKAVDSLRSLYEEAAGDSDVVGLIIGTRPDCLPSEVIELLSELNRRFPVIVEIGAETSHNKTLSRINRGHTWEDVVNAVERLSAEGIDVGLHLIAGLPGETEKDVSVTLDRVLELPVKSLKFHQLQIIRGTRLASLIESGEMKVSTFSKEDYLGLCEKIVCRIVAARPDIAIERFLSSAPKDMVISPSWGLKNYEFVNLLHNRLSKYNHVHPSFDKIQQVSTRLNKFEQD